MEGKTEKFWSFAFLVVYWLQTKRVHLQFTDCFGVIYFLLYSFLGGFYWKFIKWSCIGLTNLLFLFLPVLILPVFFCFTCIHFVVFYFKLINHGVNPFDFDYCVSSKILLGSLAVCLYCYIQVCVG